MVAKGFTAHVETSGTEGVSDDSIVVGDVMGIEGAVECVSVFSVSVEDVTGIVYVVICRGGQKCTY